MPYYKKIKGSRLYLSPVDASETDVYLKWMNEDTELAVNFGQYPLSVASRDDLGWLYSPPENARRFAIVLNDGDRLIGGVSLHNIDHLNRNAYAGIFIGGAENRNKGYGTETLRLLLGYGFGTLNLHSVNLTVRSCNPAAVACYKKAGFREAGRLPEVYFIDGRYVDKIYMSVLDTEFSG